MLEQIVAARRALSEAEAIIVAAGAGMGVDSGLPDFRGNEGLWQAYPPFAKLGLGFSALANPRWFAVDPALAWGFYGHRLHLYRDTVPHRGFALLRDKIAALGGAGFVFTSNVDGQFQRAGFDADQVCEAHGSIHHLQCTRPDCASGIWDASDTHVTVDMATMRAAEPWPHCPSCGAMARPNVFMFGDGAWRWERSDAQERRFAVWLQAHLDRRLVIVELGAGSAVPTVRRTSEQLVRRGATLVRINTREPDGPPGTIGIAQAAAATLAQLLAPEARSPSQVDGM